MKALKVIDKIAFAIFSILMLIIAVVYMLVYFDIMSYQVLEDGMKVLFMEEPIKTVLLVTSIVVFILAIKAILFDTESLNVSKTAIEIKGADGILEITPTTIEHIALISLSSYPSISDISAKMRTKEDGVVVDISFAVLPDTNITELVEKLQKTIKEKIEGQTSAKVLEVNITVKDVTKSRIKEKEE